MKVQTINAHAAFVLCQAFSPAMKRKGGGAIVNMLSITLSGGWTEKVPYVMSKGALLGLTRSLARELGRAISASTRGPGASPTELDRKHGGTIAQASTVARLNGSRCPSAPTSGTWPRRRAIFSPTKAASLPARNCM